MVGTLIAFLIGAKTLLSNAKDEINKGLIDLNNYLHDVKFKLTPFQFQNFVNACKALKKVGATNEQLLFMIPQVAWETGHFKSPVSQTDNNLSGIKYYGQSGATKGTPAPKNEGDNYAHFNSYEDWAKDYLRILNRGKEHPIDATDLQTFASRLKANNYFGDSLENYLKGITVMQSMYKPYINAFVKFESLFNKINPVNIFK